MRRGPSVSLGYLGAHLEETLATDPRVSEQGLHVEADAGVLVVRGTVSTPERLAAIDAVARESVPGVAVRNAVEVVALAESEEEEDIR
jgi:hypothetical protein